ncbi:MAG: type II toxin-antitoxin system RelE/ParE family toxin [Candidatus Poribacteria bacterium]|nr:type II toxin-antitoxin system RelE/ParE family toxin [Candidatus Poribacteria bacterium]
MTPRAERNLGRLDRQVMGRIAQRIDALAQQPQLGKLLKGRLRGKWSLRVGDYRVIYRLNTVQRQVIVEDIGHRRDIYD